MGVEAGNAEGGVVGARLRQPEIHTIEWVREWVRVITAMHHAIDQVESPSLDGI